MNRDVVIITGPTASGKTGLAAEVARVWPAEVVSADSMQVYRGMDIGTAKPSQSLLKEIPHHLIDIRNPGESFSVAEFKKLADIALDGILAREKLPLIVGGTGLYLDALIHNLDFSKCNSESRERKRYMDMAEENGAEFLHAMLRNRDEQAAQVIHPRNVRRVIRALEILDGSGENLADYKEQARNESPYTFHLFLLFPEKEQLDRNIALRVEGMLQNGFLEEVRHLMKQFRLEPDTLRAIGYREAMDYLHGFSTWKEMAVLIKRKTMQYAKRQITWMKRYRDAVVIHEDSPCQRAETVLKTLSNRGIIERNQIF